MNNKTIQEYQDDKKLLDENITKLLNQFEDTYGTGCIYYIGMHRYIATSPKDKKIQNMVISISL